MQACHWKAQTLFNLKDLTWSDNNNMYLVPVVAAQQVLDPSPQHTHLGKKRGGGGAHPLQPGLQEFIPGPRYWFPLQMFTVRSCIFNCIMYLLFSVYQCTIISYFIALILPIQWTIANPVGADRPAKRQKKTSCVSTGWPVPVLCIR